MKIYQLAKKPDKQYHPHTTVCYDTHGSWAFLYRYYPFRILLTEREGGRKRELDFSPATCSYEQEF